MRYYTPDMVAYWLGKIVTAYSKSTVSNHNYYGGIRLLSTEEEKLLPECLYIGDSDSVISAISRNLITKQGAFIISGRGNQIISESVQIPPQLSLIQSSLPLFALYNLVQENIHRYLGWERSLQEVIYSNSGLQEMLERSFSELRATILLLNPGFKHIASVYSPDVEDATASELAELGYQSYETISSLRCQTPLYGSLNSDYVEYVSTKTGNYTIVLLINYHGSLVARLCIILNGPRPNPCCADLSRVLAGYISDYLFSNHAIDYGNNALFGSLVADLIECRLTDPEELNQRLKQLKLSRKRYYHVMVVSFQNQPDRTSIPWNYIISQLQYIFPFSDAATYNGDIIMVIRKRMSGTRMLIDQPTLKSLLEQYNGFAALGNFSEFLTSLPPLYHQTKDALRLGRKMHPEDRIYYYEDYSVYQIIEMAYASMWQNIGSRNIVHLCHPALIALILYDREHDSDMADSLYSYLRHERSTGEAANELFIHRNTMLFKLKKIEKIICQDLDDPILRERLLFSYHVLEYMRCYRGEDLLLLKANRSDNGTM